MAPSVCVCRGGEGKGDEAMKKVVSEHTTGMTDTTFTTQIHAVIPSKLFKEFDKALCLAGRGKRVNVCKFRPRDRLHLCCGVELHGTRPKGNHRMHQGDVFVLRAEIKTKQCDRPVSQ